jgi:hypothetical protein
MLAAPKLKIGLKHYELAPIPIRMVHAAQVRPPLTLGVVLSIFLRRACANRSRAVRDGMLPFLRLVLQRRVSVDIYPVRRLRRHVTALAVGLVVGRCRFQRVAGVEP